MDIENKRIVTKGKGGQGEIGKLGLIDTHYYI